MTLASVEPSKELYELSGWLDDDMRTPFRLDAPYYSLGFLLRKLPTGRVSLNSYNSYSEKGKWIAALTNGYKGPAATAKADTPEDAACKLTIELFKQGILTKN